jgi:uncharacterized protein YutE (UPF0331/DUF86 family)
MTSFLRHLPSPLLDDIVEGRCIPIVGAGFSRNANLPAGIQMPDWEALSRALADQIPDFEYHNALDAISAYDHLYSRAKLVEELTHLLQLHVAQPGIAHKAFCLLPFDLVVTTNFEFLLERGYESVGRYCRPIVDEDQLSTHGRTATVDLLKLHGDLNHPGRLIATEEDYDTFISRHPLVATFLANLLIGKTALFIGYSLDDPDFRSVWQIIGDRLGRLRRLAYTIRIGADSRETARFERRGVRVINLPGKPANYPSILEELFGELREYWLDQTAERSARAEETSLAELVLPKEATSRLCLVIAPREVLSFYRANVFPAIEQRGFQPVTAEDLFAPGEPLAAKLSALISRSELILLDVSTRATMMEAGLVLSQRKNPDDVLVILEMHADLPLEWISRARLIRPADLTRDAEEFVAQIDQWLKTAEARLAPRLEEEPQRLLESKEYRAAVVSAVALLEQTLRITLGKAVEDISSARVPLNQLLRLAQRRAVIPADMVPRLRHAVEVRNQAVHAAESVSSQVARKIVRDVMELVRLFKGGRA